MAETVVPIDHEPEFDHALVPVEYDPFAAEKIVNPIADAVVRTPEYMARAAGKLIDTARETPFGLRREDVTDIPGSSQPIDPLVREATGMAVNTMGTGAIAGVPVRAGEAVLGAGPIRAYHGSPHDFDKFSLDKIGTGEGAQAYGHGLYFAENPKVAEAYKNDPKMMDFVHGKDWTPIEEDAFKYLHESGYDPKAASDAVMKRISQARMYGDTLDSTAELFHTKNLIDSGWMPPRGKMYEVQINADPEHFLDWDKPLSEQPQSIQDLVANGPSFLSGNTTRRGQLASPSGEDIYRRLGVKVGPQEMSDTAGRENAATQALREAGIPGIKYLDQGSRGAGEGSRNFVVFDDKLVDIIKKYGIAGLPAPLAAAASQQFTPVDHDPFAETQ
jgi:hypothetical protein